MAYACLAAIVKWYVLTINDDSSICYKICPFDDVVVVATFGMDGVKLAVKLAKQKINEQANGAHNNKTFYKKDFSAGLIVIDGVAW